MGETCIHKGGSQTKKRIEMAVEAFKVSTEELNTHNLVIRTAGGDFNAFLSNPVMLLNHDIERVIGRWENLRVEGTELFAEPVFDLEDEEGMKISGKVERGFLKAASIGLRPLEAREVQMGDKVIIEVLKWELREISIVSIPSNRGALKLLDSNNEEIALSDVISLCDPLPTKTITPKKMEIKDLAKVLSLADTATEAEIQIALNDAVAAKARLTALEQKIVEDKKSEAISLIDAAIADKRLTATLKDQYVKLAAADFDLFKAQLASLPKAVNLADYAKNAAVTAESLSEDETAIKLYDSLDRKGDLVKLKKENPTEFERIYTAKWGKKPL